MLIMLYVWLEILSAPSILIKFDDPVLTPPSSLMSPLFFIMLLF